jgi:CheY-like chemotaxis protein
MSEGSRVLVAEDDEATLASIAHALEDDGFSVVRATSGAELIARIRDEGPFALIVTDVSMPWMSGAAALEAARRAGLRTPTVVITGLPARKIPPLVEGAVLLQKPFDRGALLAAVARALERPD